MANSTPSQESLLNALRTVKDPDLGKDLVTLDMIRDLSAAGDGTVSVRVVLTTPACPLKEKIKSDVDAALRSVAGVTATQIKMDSEVKRTQVSPSQQTIPGVQHIIAVSSGKGGVGKSTVAVNLAYALAAEGAKVGLMDADLLGPNVPTMTGVTGSPKIVTRGEAGEFLLPHEAHGVKVISMGLLTNPDQPMIWRGPMLHSAMMQFCHRVEWGQLDYLVVDMPPGTGDVQLSLAQLVPLSGAVMVTTPQEVSVQDVRKAFAMWDKVRVPVLGVVENMSYFICDGCDRKHALFGDGGGVLLSKRYNVPLLAKLPLVPAVREGGDLGMPVVARHPDSEVAKEFRKLGRTVAQSIEVMTRKHGAPSPEIQIGKF